MGVVLAGVILGHAAVVHAGLEAVQSQSYGSEARGTAAKSEVIISDTPIRYPKVLQSDYLVAMSQKALELYLKNAKKKSVVILDPDLVDDSGLEEDYKVIRVPAMKTADELGMRLVANMVMLGALVKISGLFPIITLEKAVSDIVKSGAQKLDIQAVQAGASLF